MIHVHVHTPSELLHKLLQQICRWKSSNYQKSKNLFSFSKCHTDEMTILASFPYAETITAWRAAATTRGKK